MSRLKFDDLKVNETFYMNGEPCAKNSVGTFVSLVNPVLGEQMAIGTEFIFRTLDEALAAQHPEKTSTSSIIELTSLYQTSLTTISEKNRIILSLTNELAKASSEVVELRKNLRAVQQ